MRTLITYGTILTPQKIITGHTIIVEDRKIAEITRDATNLTPQAQVIDAMGGWVAPGLIDVHIHGVLGTDTMQATYADIHTIAKYLARHGVTSCLLTTWSAEEKKIINTLEKIKSCPQPVDGAQHLGVHVEGPYINLDYRGAQRLNLICKPDPYEFSK